MSLFSTTQRAFERWFGTAKDKFLHFWGGLFTSIIFNAIMDYWGYNPAVFGTLCSSGGWAAKEYIYDKLMKKGTPEWNDWTSSNTGAIIGTLFYWIFRLLLPLTVRHQ